MATDSGALELGSEILNGTDFRHPYIMYEIFIFAAQLTEVVFDKLTLNSESVYVIFFP